MKKIEPRFVDIIPDNIDSGILYISAKYNTTIHMCACGCGSEIAIPLSPTDWKLTFDGGEVSLHPSIGNWNLPCQSHYWITNNKIEWARKWSREEIEAGRSFDRAKKQEYFNRISERNELPEIKEKNNLWRKIKQWFR